MKICLTARCSIYCWNSPMRAGRVGARSKDRIMSFRPGDPCETSKAQRMELRYQGLKFLLHCAIALIYGNDAAPISATVVYI